MLFFLYVGVCPQENVLFDFLTVKEHLECYCGLKGVEGEEADAMVTLFIVNDHINSVNSHSKTR